MRFTIIGHSTLFIETAGRRILVDPWLFGSCYWRSWWHYPPTAEVDPAWLAPDFIYVTHHHFDHFHYPTMRRLDRGAHVLVPRFGIDVMAGEVRGLGFEHVEELGHGEIRELVPGLRVASYQYGFDDTAFVVAEGERAIVDLNDCKIRGRALQQIRRDFGSLDVMLKGHSFAHGYPLCYEAEDPRDLDLVTRESFTSDFIEAARELRPRHAVPFASMVGFLHPDSRHVNPHHVTPDEVARACAGADMPDTEVVTLVPGDQWDSEEGFVRSGIDWYEPERRERELNLLAERVRSDLEAQEARESRHTLDFETFATYLGSFLRALPPGVPRLLLERPMVFEVPSSPEPYWVVDCRRARITRCSRAPDERAGLIRLSEGVIADAIEKRILAMTTGSMRMKTALRPGGVETDLAFWGLVHIWEMGYLPISRVLRPRLLAAAWRRRREGLDVLGALAGGGSMLRRLSQALAPGDRPEP